MGQGAGSIKMSVVHRGRRWGWALLVYGQPARAGYERTRALALTAARRARREIRQKWGRCEGSL
jgi:hypothetical protein